MVGMVDYRTFQKTLLHLYQLPKPTTKTVPEDDTLDNIEIYISSDESDNEGKT